MGLSPLKSRAFLKREFSDFSSIILLLIALIPASAEAVPLISRCVSTATEPGLCPSSAALTHSCTAGSVDVIAGSVLNCSDIDVSVSGQVNVADGVVTLLARNLTIGQNYKIQAASSQTLLTGIDIELTGSLTLSGTLRAQNAGGGSFVAVDAQGAISVSGTSPAIDTQGVQQAANGGDIYLSSGGTVTVGSDLYLNGQDGGTDSNINSGGSLALQAAQNVSINAEVRAFGRMFSGGDIMIATPGMISVNFDAVSGGPKGKLTVEGHGISGWGGTVELYAGDEILISGPISAAGGIGNTGGDAPGGQITLNAGCGGIVLEDLIDVTGGSFDGGDLDAEAAGPITVSSTIDASSRRAGGYGGTVGLVSGRLLTLIESANVNVNGHDGSSADDHGDGGLALLAGCTLDVRGTASTHATVTALGARGGAMSLEASQSTVPTSQPSLRIAASAVLDTTGSASSGAISLQAAVKRVGYCSNNTTVACTVNSQCVLGGCNSGTCTLPPPNPDTSGVATQFHPAPTIRQNLALSPCSACS